MAPTSAALIHLAPQELHPGCLKLPDGGAEIVDHKADHGTSGEVRVVASSIRIPITSESAMSVMVFSVKPNA